MSKSRMTLATLASVALLCACGGGGGGEEWNSSTESRVALADADQAPTARLIVKLQTSDRLSQAERLSAEAVNLLSERAGVQLKALRSGALGAHVLELPHPMQDAEARAVVARLQQTQGVVYAEPDAHATISAIPNDPSFPRQWSLVEPEQVKSGINAVGAWDITRGSASVVVAVLDSGVLPHADLVGRLLPGYDFVSDLRTANDLNGRDPDAADPGDWISAIEAPLYSRTTAKSSSWHGTHVAGIVAANANNRYGISGVAPNVRILPVRVLGKGGGTGSDIADGIVWAAGGQVPGVPMNPYPAKVINLSLGGFGLCTQTYQNAINFARSRGATVVVAAGNENGFSSSSRPANCAGVIAVAASNKEGDLASYSNFGNTVALTAPGGDDGAGIVSLGDQGTREPLNDHSLLYSNGTSMAAPAVTGVVALMLSVNPGLTPDQVQEVLSHTASRGTYRTGSRCNLGWCGAGHLNALSAVRAVSAGEIGDTLPTPQSGWWWNEGEGGRGYALEFRNGALFMAGFMYEVDGRPMWFVSSGEMSGDNSYSGSMDRYEAGQTLDGAFKKAVFKGGFGSLNLQFASANRGVVTWPNGSTTTIRRYDIASGSASMPQTGFAPEAGWWWNADEAGRGFALEVQGDNLFIGGFMYDDAGQPVWYVSNGKLNPSTRQYSGQWLSYVNGQAIGQPYKAPQLVNSQAGALRLTFSDTRNAVLSLPGGRSMSITRYMGYGTQTPIASDPPSLTFINKALGRWSFDYKILTSTFTDKIDFDSTMESITTPGDYVAYGFDQYDNLAVVSYDIQAEEYYMLVTKPDWATFDQFYTFTIHPVSQSAQGCAYLYYRNKILHPDPLSSCYAMSGSKVANSGARSLTLATPERSAEQRARLERLALEVLHSEQGAVPQRRALSAEGASQDVRRRVLAERLLRLGADAAKASTRP